MGNKNNGNSKSIKTDHDVIMFGLDGSGKTSILLHLKGRNPYKYSCIATIGFNVESVEIDGKRMNIWDVSGWKQARSIWKNYLNNKNGIIFVIDCSDRSRLDSDHVFNDNNAKYWLYKVLQDEILSINKTIPLLIIANKQDLHNAMSVDELGVYLGIYHKYQPKDYYDTNISLPRNIIDVIINYLPIQRLDTFNGRPVYITPNVSPIYLNTKWITPTTHNQRCQGYQQFDREYPNALKSALSWLSQNIHRSNHMCL